MADDYSDIGFLINDEADFSALYAAHPEMLTRRKNIYGGAVELFARNLAVYENADDYMVRRKGSTAPESIISFGSFSLYGKAEEFEPDPVADVSGVVTEVTPRENPLHHGQYYEIGLSCLSVDFTVVADASLLPALPQVGNILKGFYWVSGRFPD